jgi:hypothetical protein
MDKKLRFKFLEKLAQAKAAPAPSSTPTSSGNTLPVAPPPTLDVWSAYPDPCKSYNPTQLQIINGLIQRLSRAVNQLTDGKFNFQALRNLSFKFDPSQFADANTKNLMLFFGKLFRFLLNNGMAFSSQPIDPTQLKNIIISLKNAPELMNLSQVNQSGPVANQAPGNNNLYQTIQDTLQRL